MITLSFITIFLLLGVGIVIYRLGWGQKGYGISILVPFQCADSTGQRARNWAWLRKYWREQLPGAEIVMGRDYGAMQSTLPFSKSVAVNDAVSKANGDVYVIVDADGYISTDVILQCAKEIREARKRNYRLWFMPYRQFYRLNEEATERVLQSPIDDPYQYSKPSPNDLQSTTGSQMGHWFGALIQVVPSEAFDIVGGWDTRFRGWGGEDHAAMRAFDTLYWPHKTINSPVFHLWHPMFSPTGTSAWVDWKSRTWEGQTSAGANDVLSGQYYEATGDVERMRKLVDAGLDEDESERFEHRSFKHEHHRHPHKHHHHHPQPSV